jgi:hypothetical protein
MRSTPAALLFAVVLWVMFLEVIAVRGATSFFYVDPDFRGSFRDGSAARPWQYLGDSGAWTAINGALAAGPVTVYFSARDAGSDTNQASTVGLTIDRTDGSTNRLTLDGMSRYNTNDASPSWAAYSGRSRHQITSSAVVESDNESSPYPDRNYVTIRGFAFISTGRGHAQMVGMNYLIFELNDYQALPSASGGPGVITGVPFARENGVHRGTWSSHIIIRGNTIHDEVGECIYIGASTPDPPGSGGLLETPEQTGTDILIQGNTITNCGRYGGQGDGIDIKDGNTNVRVIGNTIQRTAGYSGCDCQCIVAESADLIESNFCRIDAGLSFPGRGSGPPQDGLELSTAWHNSYGRRGITIRNNIIVGMFLDAISVPGAINAANAWQTVTIYNNSIYSAGRDCVIAVSADGSLPRTITIENNICSTPAHNGIEIPLGPAVVHTYNDFFNIADSALSIGGRTTSCANITTSEANSICADPQFVNTASPYASSGFKLASSSPAIGRALLLTSFNTDFFGALRRSPWDIGAAAYTIARPAFPSALQRVHDGTVPPNIGVTEPVIPQFR